MSGLIYDTEIEQKDLNAKITYDRSYGANQRALAAKASAIREQDRQHIERHMDRFGTTCSYYGRNFRNPLTYRYYIKD